LGIVVTQFTSSSLLVEHPLLVKYSKLRRCTFVVVTIILNFALFGYFTSNPFHYQLDPHLVPVIEYS